MFLDKLKVYFLIVCAIASIILIYLWYENYTFENSPLNTNLQNKISQKHKELKYLAYKKFNVTKNIPVVISDKMPSKIYGMATINNSNKIVIYLNKKRFKESSSYMLDDVLPHEYAHALMFVFNDFSKKNAGHTKRWQNICKELNGIKCDKFVDNHEIVNRKTKFLYDW